MLRRLLRLLGVVREGGRSLSELPRAAAGRGAAPTASLASRTSARTDYAAVAISPGPRCCEPAKQAFGRKFLRRDAPGLPLPGCSSPQSCACRFREYDDRRQDDRRDPFGGNFGWNAAAGDRRHRRGRRSTDH